VIDVRATVAWHAAVVQQEDACSGEQLVESRADPDLAVTALLPSTDAGRLFDHLCEQPADLAELLTRVLVASFVTVLVFAQRARARAAGVYRLRRSD
jgi:hypothetical protein